MTDNNETSSHPASTSTPYSMERQSLTLVDGNDDAANPNNNSEDDDTALTPLFERVLQIIKASSRNSNGSITIRPARLAAELGDVSVNEACAELCGLMAAIGGGGENGATFTFEKLTPNNNVNNNADVVMVFTFPHDFEQRARAHQRHDSIRQVLYEMSIIGIKIIKIMTAFGLILSLLILTMAAAMGIVAAIVALSRDRQQQHSRTMLIRQLHTLFYTIRQLLWCFAVFGPTGGSEDEDGNGQDPFLREVAYDLFLVCSLCCGNPLSAFYWIRASQLSRRRQRAMYGWGGQRQRLSGNEIMESSVPGVTLVRRGAWADDDLGTSSSSSSSASHRGLLSVAVEFLFGPTPFHPAPSEAQKWKLRAAVLVQQLSLSKSSNSHSGISMEEMSPYVDYPPALLSTTNIVDKDAVQQLVSQALKIVAHFNGIPVTITSSSSSSNNNNNNDNGMAQTCFVFPELLAESTVALQGGGGLVNDDEDDDTWASLLYAKEQNSRTLAQRRRQQDDLPVYLHEHRYKFTKLTGQQFLHCVGLGSLNAIGVVMLGQSLVRGGVLYMGDPAIFSSSWSWYLVHKMLLPVLRFYAALFFVLPAIRLLWIVILNQHRQRRNRQRKALVNELLERQQQQQQ